MDILKPSGREEQVFANTSRNLVSEFNSMYANQRMKCAIRRKKE